MAEDGEKLRVEKLNRIYVGIIKDLIHYTIDNGGQIRFSEFIEHIKEETETFENYTEERIVFTTMLKLYDIGFIDIEKWKAEQEDVIMNITEEFNLEYCLSEIQEEDENLYHASSILVSKEDNSVFEVENMYKHEEMAVKIEVTDFIIKVDKKNGAD